MAGKSWEPTPEYRDARAAAIREIVAQAPPLTSAQMQTLRRIFGSAEPAKRKRPGRP